VNRRELLKKLSTGVVPNEASDPVVQSVHYRTAPSAGSPRQYTRGDRVLITSARAWLCYDEIGFYAVEAYCPHLGCLVHPQDGGFGCPCHQSQFTATGQRQSGPAPRGLRYVHIDLDSSGSLIIRPDLSVNPDDRLIA
jgi:Rieske Fe-S protein